MNSGLLLFGRYAFPPNRLGYCGSDDHPALFGYLTEGRADGGLLELSQQFEGAYPYLRLIATANDIPDPFDPRVVEAYWIGNACLERVEASPFYESLKERFRSRMSSRSFGWMTSVLEWGARPHHNFHVLEVYRRAGLMRDDRAAIGIERMDQCRVSWGRVIAVEGQEAIVKRSALELRDGKLVLGRPKPVRATLRLDGRGYVEEVRVGDIVSMHWSWICAVLTPSSLRRLIANTHRALVQTNTSL